MLLKKILWIILIILISSSSFNLFAKTEQLKLTIGYNICNFNILYLYPDFSPQINLHLDYGFYSNFLLSFYTNLNIIAINSTTQMGDTKWETYYQFKTLAQLRWGYNFKLPFGFNIYPSVYFSVPIEFYQGLLINNNLNINREVSGFINRFEYGFHLFNSWEVKSISNFLFFKNLVMELNLLMPLNSLNLLALSNLELALMYKLF